MHIGYIRVSSADQNPDRQLADITTEKTFIDYISGKSTDRPQLMLCLDFVREGDTLHVHSIDRLARNLSDLLFLLKKITGKGAVLQFHKEGLVFTGDDSPTQKLYLQIIGAMAEFERELIRARQREGIELAKKKGVYTGRKRALTKQEISELCAAHRQDGKTVSWLARKYKVSRMTVYRYLKAFTFF